MSNVSYFFSSHADAALKEEFPNFEFTEEILTNLDLYPEIFCPAMKAMLAQRKKNIHTDDTHLCSAIHTFGKYNGAARALQKKSGAKRRTTKLTLLKGTGSIGVHPTTAARRRPHIWVGEAGDHTLVVLASRHMYQNTDMGRRQERVLQIFNCPKGGRYLHHII